MPSFNLRGADKRKSESRQTLVGGEENNQHAKGDQASIENWTSCGCHEWSSIDSSSSTDDDSASLCSRRSFGGDRVAPNDESAAAADGADGGRPITIIMKAAQLDGGRRRFKLSKKRWFILAGLCVFGFLNGLVNELTAITSTLTDLLGWQLDEYIYMSQIFNYLRPLIALPCAALIDRFGLRRATYLALALACLRNMSRMLLFSPHLTTGQSPLSSLSWQEMKYTYWAGCMLCENLVVSLYYSLPLKVSEDWFAQQERSIALSCMFILPTLGSASASLLLPHIVESSGGKTPSFVGGQLQLEASELGLSWLAALNFLAALLSIVVVLTTVTRSRPRQAPSQRSFQARENLRQATTSSTGGQRSPAIWVNMKNLLTNFNLLLHMFARTSIDTLATTVNSLAQDVFASADLSQTFCGNFLALNGIFGALIQVLSSRHLDKNCASAASDQVSDPPPTEGARKRTRLMRVQMLLVCLFFVMYLGALSQERLLGRSHQWLFVIGCSLAYSFVWFWTAPFSNDLVADLILLNPVSQATVSAFGGAFYVLLINPYQMLFIHLRRRQQQRRGASSPHLDETPAPLLRSTTTAAATKTEKPDYSRSMLFAGLVASSATLAYVTCFRAPAAGDQHFAAGGRRQPASEEAINDAVTPADNNNNNNKACARCRSARPAAAPAALANRR